MSLSKSFLQRTVFFMALFLCLVDAWYYTDSVDCEKRPFHPLCRGQQLRKRIGTDDYSFDDNHQSSRTFIQMLSQPSKIKHAGNEESNNMDLLAADRLQKKRYGTSRSGIVYFPIQILED